MTSQITDDIVGRRFKGMTSPASEGWFLSSLKPLINGKELNLA